MLKNILSISSVVALDKSEQSDIKGGRRTDGCMYASPASSCPSGYIRVSFYKCCAVSLS